MCKQICNRSEIGKSIINNQSLDKFKILLGKYPIIKHIGKIKYNLNIPNNLKIYENFKNCNKKQDMNEIQLKMAFQEIKNNDGNYKSAYTDGSKRKEKCGLGTYIDDNNIISVQQRRETSIKTTELLAIYLALVNLINNNHKKIIIYTDSKSACTSIKNCTKNKSKYYESIIIELADELPDHDIKIQWIPGHIGILGNEQADIAAKRATLEGFNDKLENNKVPIEDIILIIKNKLFKEWKGEYEKATRTKGLFNRIINDAAPPKITWFRNMHMKTQYIKIINRIRAGHTYNKIFKHRIESNDKCNICNVKETDLHITDRCPKFKILKSKYKKIEGKTLIEILKGNKIEELLQLSKFYIETKIED